MLSNRTNQSCYILGHRGARAEVLENSTLGFCYAQNLQFNNRSLDGVEFDIQMTADGEFIVVHDATLARLTHNQSWVMDNSLAQLQAIRQSDRTRYQVGFDSGFLAQPILRLLDILPLLSGYQHIELEIKTHVKSNPSLLVENLLRLLCKADWQQLPITLTSFDTDVLLQLHNQQPLFGCGFAIGLLLEPHATLASQISFLPTADKWGDNLMYAIFNQACALGCSQVGVYHALITPKLVELAKRLNLAVTAWTVNEVDEAKSLIDMGVNCVITDYPTKLLQSF